MEAIYKAYSDLKSNSLTSKGMESKLTEKRAPQNAEQLPQIARIAKNYTESTESVTDNQENRMKIELALKALEAARPNTSSRYQVHINVENKRLQLQLVNQQTGEVIEEIPSRRLLDFYSILEELNGFFFEKKA